MRNLVILAVIVVITFSCKEKENNYQEKKAAIERLDKAADDFAWYQEGDIKTFDSALHVFDSIYVKETAYLVEICTGNEKLLYKALLDFNSYKNRGLDLYNNTRDTINRLDMFHDDSIFNVAAIDRNIAACHRLIHAIKKYKEWWDNKPLVREEFFSKVKGSKKNKEHKLAFEINHYQEAPYFHAMYSGSIEAYSNNIRMLEMYKDHMGNWYLDQYGIGFYNDSLHKEYDRLYNVGQSIDDKIDEVKEKYLRI